MEELVFATYVREIKAAWKGTISNEDLINLLYGAIVYPCDVQDKNGEFMAVTKQSASRLMLRKDNVSPKINKHAEDDVVIKEAKGYFEKHVVKELMQSKRVILMNNLVRIINDDNEINFFYKSMLLQNAHIENLAVFLADVFRYSITRRNKNPEKKKASSKKRETTVLTIGDNRKQQDLEVIPTPKDITPDERTYVDALLQAYGQTLGISNLKETDLELYPRMKRDLSRQRRCYFAAEAVRRGIRDVYIEDDQDHFQVLKDEVFDGVVDVFEEKHKSGMDRLSKVMAQAAIIHTDRSLLVRETVWIGVSQKKGVCHFLIGDGSLTEWVRDDDEQFV